METENIENWEIIVHLPNASIKMKVGDSIIVKKCELLCCEPESALDSILRIKCCGKQSELKNGSDSEKKEEKEGSIDSIIRDDKSMIKIENIGHIPLTFSTSSIASRLGNKVFIYGGVGQMKSEEGVKLAFKVDNKLVNDENDSIIHMCLQNENEDISIKFIDAYPLKKVYIPFKPGEQRTITNLDKICIGTRTIVEFERKYDDPWGDFSTDFMGDWL